MNGFKKAVTYRIFIMSIMLKIIFIFDCFYRISRCFKLNQMLFVIYAYTYWSKVQQGRVMEAVSNPAVLTLPCHVDWCTWTIKSWLDVHLMSSSSQLMTYLGNDIYWKWKRTEKWYMCTKGLEMKVQQEIRHVSKGSAHMSIFLISRAAQGPGFGDKF